MWKIVVGLIFVTVVFSVKGQFPKIQLANGYYEQGEEEKARRYYEDLAQRATNIPHIHENYLQLLRKSGNNHNTQVYLERILSWYPNNLSYHADELNFYREINQVEQVEKKLFSLLSNGDYNTYHFREIGIQLTNRKMYDLAKRAYQEGRRQAKSDEVYALELAKIHAYLNEKEDMVNEYLTYASLNSRNTNYIKNIFQDLLRDDEELTYLESVLVQRAQQDPEERIFSELLIWVEVQRSNYQGAFIQARALDRREGTGGQETYEVGRMALRNRSWDEAITIFEYLSKNYQTPGFNKHLIEAREEKIKHTNPVDEEAIRSLSGQYAQLYEQLGPNRATLEGLKNQARLHAFYLGEIEKAAILLRRIINESKSGPELIAECKLELGDIYLLKGEPWEATLLYAQVEKSEKGEPLSYEAKLRNARLHYYIGNFSLSKGHLDVLKQATTKDIANDAMDLSLLIADNTYLDATDQVMVDYAAVELLLFQNRTQEAEGKLLTMLERYENHSIRDELYWMMARIEERKGNYESAMDYLIKIREEYPYDILADDAAFKQAEMTHFSMSNKQSAQKLYQEFLTKFPGSRYAAEARKRFRMLRGDYGA